MIDLLLRILKSRRRIFQTNNLNQRIAYEIHRLQKSAYRHSRNCSGDDIDGESAGDVLGFAVSISDDGNTIAAGSRWDDDGGADSGSAGFYRYTAANNTWWQIGQNVDGLGAGDSLGYDIALSSDGNRVVIGSPQNDQVGTDSGLIQTFVVSSDAESNVESMLVNVWILLH